MLGEGKARDAECYRLLWSRTFHNPVCLRLDTSPDGAVLTVKRWAGKGGYDWGALAENKQVKLSRSDFDHFLHLLALSGFWNAPFDQPGAEGTDGSEWTMESLSKNQYHAIDRPNGAIYDPERVTPWLWLIKRAGLTFASPDDIY